LCIEFDCQQHSVGWNGNKNILMKIQINDAIKTNYCLANNIELLRIPYTEFKNIESILKANLLA